MAGSGTSFGQRTDMKRLGPIASPWTIPQCPGNKFIIYKENFTPEELKKYTNIIESSEYKNIPENAPTYYYLARFFEMSGDFSNGMIAYTYLQASWQVEKAGDFRTSILQNSLKYYEKALEDAKDQSPEKKAEIIIITGELNRLLKNFSEAEKIFKNLKNDEVVQKSNVLKKIADFELELIKEKDSLPRELKL